MDKVYRILSRINALRSNIREFSTSSQVESKYVIEYNTMVDELAVATKDDLTEFKIPAGYTRPVQISSRAFSPQSYCEKIFYLSKLDSVISYLSMKYSIEPPGMGFSIGEE